MGIKRMRKAMKAAGLKDPEFETNGFFRVVFYRSEQFSGKATVSESAKKTREKTKEKTKEKILAAIGDNTRVTISELAHILGLTQGGIEWNIKKLKSAGVLKRVGSDKGGHWKVVK